MYNKTLISTLIWGIFLVLIQIIFLKNLALFGIALCFLYLMIILHLPIHIPAMGLVVLSFVSGLLIDTFYDTGGMHAAGATLLGFIRPFWLRAIRPIGGYDDGALPTMQEMGVAWYISYSLPLVFIFSLVFFTLDQWGTVGFLNILNKSIFSTILTLLLILLLQALVFKQKRGGL